ncbi:MAG: tetratricopeptide repeat protein [Janthinobacterium lividum]
MNLRILCGGLCVAVCTASIALAQSFGQQAITGYSGMKARSGPSTVVFTPKMRADFLQEVALNDAAQLALNEGDYDGAETNARQALSLMRGDSEAPEILAVALDAQGKTQEALQAYKALHDAGAVTPVDELPYARLLLETGHWAQAVEAYNKQLPYSDGDLMQAHSDFSPDVPRSTDMATAIHVGMGQALGWRGYHGTYQERTQQAQEQFRQALALEPKSSLANYYVGYGLKRMGRRAEAQAAFKKAAALDNGDVQKAALKELPVAMQPR